MKKSFCLIIYLQIFLTAFLSLKSYAQLLNGYNQKFYSDILSSCEGIAMPYLLQQGYKTLPGVTVCNDTMLKYLGQVYSAKNKYQNPESGNSNNYYLNKVQYSYYQIDVFKNVWPFRIPNDFYNYSDFSFSSLTDCVGFGTRILSAAGDSSKNGNAYLKLISTVKSSNTTPIAVRGYVASAYQIGAVFPTLPDSDPGGWEYVSGNIIADSINAYNHRLKPSIQHYNGRSKGGFNFCKPGDILSFSYAPGGNSNGHFMVIAEIPYLLGSDSIKHFYPNVSNDSIRNFLKKYNVYAAPVYDCSGKNVHFHDSRTFTSGIGHGTIWILTEPSTEIPVGFIFSPPSEKATMIRPKFLNNKNTWAISVGRFNSK